MYTHFRHSVGSNSICSWNTHIQTFFLQIFLNKSFFQNINAEKEIKFLNPRGLPIIIGINAWITSPLPELKKKQMKYVKTESLGPEYVYFHVFHNHLSGS